MSQFIIQGSQELLSIERSRIVGLCASLTGNVDVAEDLAQEVMLEAWRSIERLRDATQFSHWLSGIARNVCLRWVRKQGRHHAHVVQLQLDQDTSLEEQLIDDVDLEVELERKELIALLDRALTLLSPITREVLIARYIEESSLAEVAEKLGIQTGAVAMRLQRGKLALRRVLSVELQSDVDAYGLRDTDEWQQTSIWCPHCGQQRLKGKFAPSAGILYLNCPTCGDYSHSNLGRTSVSQLFVGVKRVKSARSRLQAWIYRHYRDYLGTRSAPCLRCGRLVPLHIVASLKDIDSTNFPEQWLSDRGVYSACVDCQSYNWTSLEGLVLALPEARDFFREHPRIRALPQQEVEVDGQAAILTRFESVTNNESYEVVSAQETYWVLRMNGRRS